MNSSRVLTHEPVEALVEAYLRPLLPATEKCYRRDLSALQRHCAANGKELLHLTTVELEDYIAELVASGLAPSTIDRRLTTAAGLYKFAVATGALSASPMDLVRRPRAPRTSQPLGLDRAGAKALLQAADRRGLRDHLVIGFLLLLGLRPAELGAATADDLEHDRGRILLTVSRKGRHRQRLPLPPFLAQNLLDYLAGRRSGPLLLSRTGRALDRSAVYRIVRQTAVAAGPNAAHATCRGLRHSFVSLALDDCHAPLHVVQHSAGHRSPTVTILYWDALTALDSHPGGDLEALLLAWPDSTEWSSLPNVRVNGAERATAARR